MKKGPAFVEYFGPVLDALRALGASARPKEVSDWIATELDLSDEILSATNKNGNSKFENQVAWARFYLAKAGYLDTESYGIWALTEAGREAFLDTKKSLKIFREVQSKFQKKSVKGENSKFSIANSESENEIGDAPESNEFLNQEEVESQLAEQLLAMSAKGFEEFSARLLREYGLENVKVIGKSADDGVDGVGELMINRFVRSKVMFQCKRYANPVPPKEIRDFRGAIQGRAERGIFLTTSTFSKNARREGTRENATPIELVDLKILIDLIIERSLGVEERRALEVDEEFFAQYIEKSQ